MYHDDKMTRHSDVRKILRKIKEIAFWNNMIKNIIKYVQECLSCQKKRLNRRLKIGQGINRLKEI